MTLRAEGAYPLRSELRTRIVSGVALAAAALAAAALGGVPFTLVVIAAAAVALWEWTAMTGAGGPIWLRAGALLCLAAGLIAVALKASDWGIGFLLLPALGALTAGTRVPAARWTGLGLLYVAAPAAALILLRGSEPFGWAAILFILVVVATTDTAAYFGGRSLGGPKLWPRVSPKKTWSGALTGLLAAVLAGGLVVGLTHAGEVARGLLLAAALSIAAQAGDLLESSVKRRFGAKDSGRIIPGHGGVLDRVDGLFTAAALAWLLAALGMGGELFALPRQIVAMSGGPA